MLYLLRQTGERTGEDSEATILSPKPNNEFRRLVEDSPVLSTLPPTPPILGVSGSSVGLAAVGAGAGATVGFFKGFPVGIPGKVGAITGGTVGGVLGYGAGMGVDLIGANMKNIKRFGIPLLLVSLGLYMNSESADKFLREEWGENYQKNIGVAKNIVSDISLWGGLLLGAIGTGLFMLDKSKEIKCTAKGASVGKCVGSTSLNRTLTGYAYCGSGYTDYCYTGQDYMLDKW